MKKTAIIIDDESNARAALRGVLQEHFPQITVVGEAQNLPEAVKLINTSAPDIVFMDIEMPGNSGLEINRFFDMETVQFALIFVTAYADHALDAFAASAIDYLVKPVEPADLSRALQKSWRLLSPSSFMAKQQPERVVIQTAGASLVVPLEEIVYLKADGSYTHVIMATGEKHIVTKRLAEFDGFQDYPTFIRIHRSHIVNVNHVIRINRSLGGSVVMSNGDELSISREKRQELDNLLSGHRF